MSIVIPGAARPDSLHERIRLESQYRPDAVAVSAGETVLTFRGLEEQANRLAHRLQRLGAGPDIPVAVSMERSIDLVVALLAVLKAGSCYLPLHGAYPADRKQWIVDSTQCPILLVDRITLERGVPDGPTVLVAGEEDTSEFPSAPPPAGPTGPDHLAYVIYTSGSTGQPKGVAVEHRQVLGLIDDPCWEPAHLSRSLMIAPFAFNVSTYELWVPLLHGGQVVLAPPGDFDVASLSRVLTQQQITAVHLTAGLFRVVADEHPHAFAGVREVLTGGDVIAPTAVARVLEASPGVLVRALYGATEVCVFSNQATITASGSAGNRISVGPPMRGVRISILDERLRPVPAGQVGEVYIGGRGVARGYFGRPDLTAERFVADPAGPPGSRMYRTGDLGSLDPQGQLDLVGRATDQVKILGFRVELAEVEAALSTFGPIADVAVIAREDAHGERRLAAYLVARTTDWHVADLRQHALKWLPEYMVPASFTLIPALPVTANGKLDRAALPEPDPTRSAHRPARTPTEAALCALFSEVLDVDQVGIDDGFFHLGGQSLFAMRLVSRIHAELGLDLPISLLFDTPTVAGLAEEIEAVQARTAGRAS